MFIATDEPEDYLPFFVYGSLRRNQHNHYLIERRIAYEQRAYLPGAKLYSLGEYPMAVETNIDIISNTLPKWVFGELIHPYEDRYEDVVMSLDRLERFEPHLPDESPYWRVSREVVIEDETTVRAWVYMGNPKFLSQSSQYIPSGDWSQHHRVPQYT